MGKYNFTSYVVADRSYISLVKREIHTLVLRGGFTPTRIGEIDIIISELTSNLVKHAGGGELLYRLLEDNGIWTFEVLSIDKGRGIENVPQMMKDGVSTSKTLGQGLGALQRLSDLFQLYSITGWGTVAYCKVYSQPEPLILRPKKLFDIKALSVPIRNEHVCGDGYRVKQLAGKTQVFFGDGLGHGEKAHDAVELAADLFEDCTETDAVEIIRHIHAHVKRTRGLVGSVAILDHEQRIWTICGVGNISTRIYSGLLFKHYLAYNGIIGLNIPNTMKSFELPAETNQTLIMCSDGLRTRWEIGRYTGYNRYDATILAAILYKDFVRGTDDASVLIGRVNF